MGNTTPIRHVVMRGITDSGDEQSIAMTSEGHAEVAIHAPLLPFGSVHTEHMEPEFQEDSVYGINSLNMTATTGNSASPGGATSATATGTNNLFKCSTGTTAYSFASIQTDKRIRYRPGQGVIARFTALFSAPAANSIVVAGVGSSESGFYFGYNGTSFGILHVTGGVREIQTLTVTTASTSTSNYNITLGGLTTNVTATNNGSTLKTAYEIAQGVYPGWKAEQRGSTVVFLADSAGNKTGNFTLAQAGAGVPAAGTYDETLAGVASNDTWIPQSTWNGDKLDGTGASGVTLDKSKGNVYQIDIQYLGFGSIVFKIEVDPTGNNHNFVSVHTISIPNTRTSPTVSQPAFPFTMSAYSAGSTTDVSVSCASCSGFIEGVKKKLGPRMSPRVETNGFVGSSASTYYPLFTIRNSLTHAHTGNTERANQSIVYPLSLSASHDDATPVTIFLIKNATLAGTPNFQKYDADSCLYWDVAASTSTIARNSQIQYALCLGQSSGGAFAFEEDIRLEPGDTLTLAARAVTGTATYVVAGLNTREDQ